MTDTRARNEQPAPFLERVGTAPITWGICEVPGWGEQLPVDRVLSEMQQCGFAGTEFGSDGYLPSDPAEVSELLASYELRAIGGWVSLVLHEVEEAQATLETVREVAERFAQTGATHFNTAAITDADWSPRQPLTDKQWDHLSRMLAEIDAITEGFGLQQVLHPHVDTVVETAEEIQRVVATSDVAFCLDTAHMAVGGCDPLEFVRNHGDRVGLVHLKDLDFGLAERLNRDELSLLQAVQAGLFCSLGRGDLAIKEAIVTLESSGYADWYVLEQDVALTEGMPPVGAGPIIGVEESLNFLRSIDLDAG